MLTPIDKMKVDMDLRGFSVHTKKSYLMYVRLFSEHFGHPAETLEEDDIRAYLHHIIVNKQFSTSNAICAYSALRFFFETTLERTWNTTRLPRAKKDKKLPVCLSKPEIKELFSVVKNLKHKAILMTAYGAGLRPSEIASLKFYDIDSHNMQILVKNGKGKRDRYTLLSKANLNILRDYWRKYKPLIWLFPSRDINKSISRKTIYSIFLNALRKTSITKRASIHSLRHSFATHLLEDGVDIRRIQQLLGHSSIQTTCVYLHLMRMDVLKIKSPLDVLEEEGND